MDCNFRKFSTRFVNEIIQQNVNRDAFNNECAEKLKRLNFEDRVAVIGSGPSCPFITSPDELVKRLSHCCHVRIKQKEFHWDFFERAFKETLNKGSIPIVAA